MASVFDEFDRIDAANLGATWREYTNGFRVVTGAAVPDVAAAANGAQLAAVMDTGSHYAQFEIGSVFGGAGVGPAIFMPSLGTSPTTTGAFYTFTVTGTGLVAGIRRKTALASTIVTLIEVVLTSDARVAGTKLELFGWADTAGVIHLRGSVNGVVVATYEDSTGAVPAEQRRIGMVANGADANLLRIARFQGGDRTVPGGNPPPAPAGLTIAGPSPRMLTVTWQPTATATSYDVWSLYGGLMPGGFPDPETGPDVPITTIDPINPGTKVGTVGVPTFTHTGLIETGIYNYAVRAVNADGVSALSATIAGVAAPGTATPPKFYVWQGPSTPATPILHTGVYNGTTVTPVSDAYVFDGGPPPPVINPTVAFVLSRTNQTATVDASGTLAGSGTILRHTVNWGDDSTPVVITEPGRTASYTYSPPAVGATYTVTVEADADDGGVDTDTKSITVPPSGARRAALWPFDSAAIWNTAMGSGALYEASTALRTANLLNGATSADIHAGTYSIPVSIAVQSDPAGTFTVGTNTYTHRSPAAAAPAIGTDRNITIIDGQTVWEYWHAVRTSPTVWTAEAQQHSLLLGNGIGGLCPSGFSGLAGLIRLEELQGLRIPHTLMLAVTSAQLKSGFVWPATAQDSDAGTTYTGQLPMGTLVAIPPAVDLLSLGLTPEGLALGRALQDYGAYVGERAVSVALYATPDCEGTALGRMRTDLNSKLWRQLRVITNSTITTVGGGGTRRQPAPPAGQLDYSNVTVVNPVTRFTATVAGQVATVDATATTAGSAAILRHVFDWGDGTADTTVTEPARITTHTYATLGTAATYTITGTAIAADAGTSAVTHTVTVGGVITPPTVNFTLTRTNQTVTVDATGTVAGTGTILRHVITWGDGAGTTTITEPTRTSAHTYTPPAAGQTYTISVNAVASDASGTQSRQITVPGAGVVPPTVNFTLAASGNTVTMDASGTVAQSAPIARHIITWGDGSATTTITEPVRTSTHTYSPPASGQTYTVAVQAVATDAGSASASKTITVGGGGNPVGTVTCMVAGAVTSSGFTVAATTSGTGGAGIRVAVSTSATLSNPLYASASSTADSAGYVKSAITGLQPDTAYFYALQLGPGIFKGETGSLRTAPARFGNFVYSQSGDDQIMTARGSSVVYDRARTNGSHMWHWNGDSGGINNTTGSEAAYHSNYTAIFNGSRSKPMLRTLGCSYVWGDHDFDGNNGFGTGGSGATVRPYAQSAFRKRVPHHPLPSASGGIYTTYVWGRVRVIVLDEFSYKSNPTATNNSSKTMIGTEQKAWFKNLVSTCPEKVILFTGHDPWPDGSNDDGWGAYSTERNELADYMLTQSGKHFTYIGSDQHCLYYDTGGQGHGIESIGCSPADNGYSVKISPGVTWGPYGSGTCQQNAQLNFTDTGGTTITRVLKLYNTGGSVVYTRTDTYNVGLPA